MKTHDIIIVGGGAIGLATARELAERGMSVGLIDRREPGQESSWAGAGMIPPGEVHFTSDTYREFARQSAMLWPELAEKLREHSSQEIEYHRCGALVLATAGSEDKLQDEITAWRAQGIDAEAWDDKRITQWNSRVAHSSRIGYFLPDQAQVRNPRYLKALIETCEQLGVTLYDHEIITQMETAEGQIKTLRTENDSFQADQYVIAAGSWTGTLLESLNLAIPVGPIRGQIVLVRLEKPFPSIIEEGKRYLVPRKEGRLLIGSTEEFVGFERECDDTDCEDLLAFAAGILPEIRRESVERTWSGFRPIAPDHLPVIGFAPSLDNLMIASGHYRAGLSLSPITGRVVAQTLCGESVDVSIEEFSPERFGNVAVLGP